MHRISKLSLALAASLFATAGFAQTYPAKPIRIIVPFPPGQATDIVGRMLAQHLSETWKQQVVIDNRPGGSAVIGMELAKNAPADGYTLITGSSGPMAVNPAIFRKLSYDPIRDFTPVSLLAIVPLIIVAHPSLPANNLKEMAALAQRRPGEINSAFAGTGTAQHLTAEFFKAKLNITLVPYKGSAPAMTDLLGGHVTLMFDSVTSSLPHIKSKKLKAFAVTGGERFPVIADVPTVKETGVADISMAGWAGLAGPAGIPKNIVDRINGETVKFFARPEVKQKVIELGSVAAAGTPEQYQEFIKSEIAKWTEAANVAKFKMD